MHFLENHETLERKHTYQQWQFNTAKPRLKPPLLPRSASEVVQNPGYPNSGRFDEIQWKK